MLQTISQTFISVNFDPHQAQKMFFHRFEHYGISFDKFEVTCASELKPYFHNNAATKIVKFWVKKAYIST